MKQDEVRAAASVRNLQQAGDDELLYKTPDTPATGAQPGMWGISGDWRGTTAGEYENQEAEKRRRQTKAEQLVGHVNALAACEMEATDAAFFLCFLTVPSGCRYKPRHAALKRAASWQNC